MSEPLLFAFSLVDTGAILFLLVYFVITLSDLECDYLNAQQCCSYLNVWCLPKLIAHAILLPFFVFNGNWLLVCMNLPIVSWLAYEYLSVKKGNTGVYDPTEILNRGQLKKYMNTCIAFLVFYLISFFIYLYCMIVSLLKEDPLEKLESLNVPEF